MMMQLLVFAAGALFGTSVALALCARSRRERARRECGRASLYGRIVDGWGKVLTTSADSDFEASYAALRRQERELLLLASDAVIHQYALLRRSTATGDASLPDATTRLMNVVVAMRRDLLGTAARLAADDIVAVLCDPPPGVAQPAHSQQRPGAPAASANHLIVSS